MIVSSTLGLYLEEKYDRRFFHIICQFLIKQLEHRFARDSVVTANGPRHEQYVFKDFSVEAALNAIDIGTVY